MSLLGLVLVYRGIARLNRKGVLPFNTGLYTADYSVSPAPVEILRVWDSLPDRILLPICGDVLPLGCAAAAVRYERGLIGYFPPIPVGRIHWDSACLRGERLNTETVPVVYHFDHEAASPYPCDTAAAFDRLRDCQP